MTSLATIRRASTLAPFAAPEPMKLQRSCACGNSSAGGDCESCRRKHEKLQRHAASHHVNRSAVAPSIVNDVLSTAGHPLDPSIRAFMESRFDHDFSGVRVHTDARASASADAVDALAYTVGNHVVFDAGQYTPRSDRGMRLLAHELAHVVQQSAGATSASPGSIDPDPTLEADARAAGESIDGPKRRGITSLQRAPAPVITDIKIDQATPENVTATFSDGHTESGECSTGKGHCCVDDAAGAAAGGVCSKARSTQIGNNCTPIGDFTVTAKVRKTGGGVEWWTQFHDGKQVALHEYTPVDGTPLSHGCVRLHSTFAQTIYHGSRAGKTRVHVQNEATPKCTHNKLQSEWLGDFATAGMQPPDGEQINFETGKKYTKAEIERERRGIEEERTALKSALGKDDTGLNKEIADVNAGAPVVSKIPRCVPALTVEEKLAPAAQKAGLAGATADATNEAFKKALAKTANFTAAEKLVAQAGEKLWQSATAAAQAGGSGTDDRQLYWTRLMMTTTIRQFDPGTRWGKDPAAKSADTLRRAHERLLNLFEQTSRGMTTDVFPAAAGTKRLLVSGFDPFGFQSSGPLEQGNPSGAAVLALDGQTLTQGTVSGRVEGVLFPVRYKDFNEGIVEQHLQPHLKATPPPDMVVSISQGGSKDFELEEWAGRRRSSSSFAENLGQTTSGPTAPSEPPGIAKGPEFLHTTVPAKTLGAMRGALGRKGAIPGETQVEDLPKAGAKVRTSPSGPPKDAGQAVEGSGGGFLSNEIFYRNSLLARGTGSTVPLVHLHTPFMDPSASDAVRNGLVSTVRRILEAALPQL